MFDGRSTAAFSVDLRLHALEMTHRGGGSHVGSCFSCADIVAVLYGAFLQLYPDAPKHPERDRFVLSKGHAGAIVYAALAERGFFPIERLQTHYADGSSLCGHISHDDMPGVEVSTGSLGQGLSIAAGMALAAKDASHCVVALLSDGECDEGATWEAAMFAAHHQLSNLIAIVDYNKLQSLESVAETLALEPFADKWRSFGWNVIEVDGHDHAALLDALGSCRDLQAKRPSVLIAHTVKGKGVPFMENSVLWHYRVARGEEYAEARAALAAQRTHMPEAKCEMQ